MATVKNKQKSSQMKSKHGKKSSNKIGTNDNSSNRLHNIDNRLLMIAEAAYFKSEKRGFVAGYEEADWLEAEKELAEIMGEA